MPCVPKGAGLRAQANGRGKERRVGKEEIQEKRKNDREPKNIETKKRDENLRRESKKKQKKAGGRHGDEAGEELSWPQRATMPFRDLRTAEMVCIEQTVSAAAPGSPR